MRLQDGTLMQMRRTWLALACVAAGALLFPAGATAKDTGACSAGTTLRLSALEASQGSLLLAEVTSAKPLADVSGEWGGRNIPLWQAAGDGTLRKAPVDVGPRHRAAATKVQNHREARA